MSKNLNLYVIDVVRVTTVQPTVHFELPGVIIVGNMVISKECVSLEKSQGTGALQILETTGSLLHK